MLREVYAVSSGSYSDYSVYCICPTQEMAQAVADKANGRHFEPDEYGYQVETFTLVEDLEDIVIRQLYHVAVDENGTETARSSWRDVSNFDPPAVGAHGWSLGPRGAFCTSPRGFEVALKGARDALAMAKAEQTDVQIPEEEINAN